jgi:uncharacterized protein YcbX
MKITDLFIYPVKSLQGIRLERSQLSVEGLPYDRQWMLVDSQGHFVTQRQLPKLATISTTITAKELILTHADAGELVIPLEKLPVNAIEVTVWESTLIALNEGEVATEWLRKAIGLFRGQALRLVRFDKQQSRPTKAKYLQAGEVSQTHFADGFPYLVTSLRSLELVNQALKEQGASPITMERFRPNIVVDGFDAPFDELFNRDIEHANSEYSLSIRKPCERCPVTTVDQTTGIRETSTQPLTVLTSLNPLSDRKGAYFGGNAILTQGEEALIKIGDRLFDEAHDVDD